MSPETPPRDNLRGAAWLMADMGLNIWALTIVKALGAGYPAAQIVFLRAAVGLLLLTPWLWRERARLGRIDRWRLHLLRVGLSALTLTASFHAVARLPFALFTAINFTRPLILMAMAALILGERIAPLRWVAGAAGLAGVVIAIGPAGAAWSGGLVTLIIAVVAGTAAIIVTRQLRGTAPVVMMLFYTGGLATLTLPLALAGWQPIAPGHLVPLLAVGAFAQAAQYCFLRAHWLGDAGVLGPLGYASLILSTAVGWLVFGEVPSARMLAGAAVIVAAALVVAQSARG